MGTRSAIIAPLANNQWAAIYCHWDGYPSHNGQILVDHYSNHQKAEALMKLGNLSILAPSLEKPEGHTFDTPVRGHCIAYGRDRDEDGNEAEIYNTMQEALDGGPNTYGYVYVYVLKDKVWHVVTDDGAALKPVTKYLEDGDDNDD